MSCSIFSMASRTLSGGGGTNSRFLTTLSFTPDLMPSMFGSARPLPLDGDRDGLDGADERVHRVGLIEDRAARGDGVVHHLAHDVHALVQEGRVPARLLWHRSGSPCCPAEPPPLTRRSLG